MIVTEKPFRCTKLLLSLMALIVTVGCGETGPELGAVKGTVTLDGQPLANASVAFSGLDNGPSAYGVTDEQGNYELEFTEGRMGTVLGQHQVSITTQWTELVKAEAGEEDGGTGENEGDDEQEFVEKFHPEVLPAKYHAESADNEEMLVEVVSGENTIDFSLTSN